MNKIWEYALRIFIVSIVIIFLWTVNPTIAIPIGFFGIVNLIGIGLEIKQYYNKNNYLTISAAILVLGLILTYIVILNITDTNRIISFILAIFLAVLTFYMAFSKTNKWRDEIHDPKPI